MGDSCQQSTFLPPMLAHTYRPGRDDPAGCWLSEKFDGVRACWTGHRLLTRTGKLIAAPEAWIAGLPPGVPLDGELSLGRGRFQETVSVVRTIKDDKGWSAVLYHVFDMPTRDSRPFEERMRSLDGLLETMSSTDTPMRRVTQIRCRDRAHLDELFRSIIADGGEGVMLRAPQSPYAVGKRSWTLLKLKPFHDAEAVVIAHVPGRGKHTGRLGALRGRCVETGVEFKIGTGFDDKQREDPPPVGAIVTYRYQERTRSGAPRFPVFIRIRHPTNHN